jgi:hypothetical protein
MPEETSFLAPGPLPLIGADFHVVSRVGRVGDGLVYVARDGLRQARLREYFPRRVVRRVADGTLHPADARLAQAWREATQRFLDQGHRLASIDHFGVAPVWRAMSVEADGVRQGAYQIGAPVGEPLSAALGAGLTVPPAQVLRIAVDLTDALAEIHARGIAHLDICPDTVSIAAGYVELTDFGVDNRPFMALLETQEGLVRPGYSPIEHYDASMAEPLGPAADVYSASALLFRLVTGRDPAPWQERWRDPSASQLSDREAYPPAFIEAIRKGLAIEPEERFRDGGEWRAAMGFPASDPLATSPRGGVDPLLGGAPLPVVPVQAPPTAPAAPAAATASSELQPDRAEARAVAVPRRTPWLVPLLLGLALLLIAVGGYLAYKQRWFFPEEVEPATNSVSTGIPAPQPKAGDRGPAPVEIEPGATVSGQLTGRDRRRAGGQFEDRYILRGAAGDRLEIRLSSGDFDPLLTVTGPGFTAANDDDSERGTRDSRLAITLPRDGRYTISASSYRRGITGNYLLQVGTARPQISIATPAMLVGRWRRAADSVCDSPAIITIEGGELVYTFGGSSTREEILDGVGRTIRTRAAESEDGPETEYELSEEGDSFEQDGTTWVRC